MRLNLSRPLILCCLLWVLVACQPTEQATLPPRITALPFPTATQGSAISGFLPTPPARSPNLADFAIPTATPLPQLCPLIYENVELGAKPDSNSAEAILDYISAGGSLVALETALRDDWDVFGETGFLYYETDLTGRGQPDLVVGYADEESAKLLVYGCDSRRYVEIYRAEEPTRPTDQLPTPPQLIGVRDINQNGSPDLVFAFRECALDRCEYRTQAIAWLDNANRFVGLISRGILSDELPVLIDVDDDQIIEFRIHLTALGDINTGPLRTGTKIYDWNGTEYVLSVTQPEPMRYQIQVIHEADRYLSAGRLEEAVRLYQRAMSDESLRIWLRNEADDLTAYVLFRLLITRSAQGQPDVSVVMERIMADYPEGEIPIYATLAKLYWEQYIASLNVSFACASVREAIETSYPDGLTLLNRYGDRNPTYTIRDICPF